MRFTFTVPATACRDLAMRNGFSGKVCEGAAVKEIKRGQDFEVQVIDGLIDWLIDKELTG